MNMWIKEGSTFYQCQNCRRGLRIGTADLERAKREFKRVGWVAMPAPGETWRYLCKECAKQHRTRAVARRIRRDQRRKMQKEVSNNSAH